jgi:hypothetical protein
MEDAAFTAMMQDMIKAAHIAIENGVPLIVQQTTNIEPGTMTFPIGHLHSPTGVTVQIQILITTNYEFMLDIDPKGNKHVH